jgi:hypothetical protein
VAADAQPARETGVPRVSVGFVVGRATISEGGGSVRVEVPVLSEGRSITVVTEPVSVADAEVIAGSVSEGRLVDFLTSGREVVVAAKPGETFHTALAKGSSPTFVTRKYGPELARRNNMPGAMVVAGWVYAKGRRTITVGDGRVVRGGAGRVDPPRSDRDTANATLRLPARGRGGGPHRPRRRDLSRRPDLREHDRRSRGRIAGFPDRLASLRLPGSYNELANGTHMRCVKGINRCLKGFGQASLQILTLPESAFPRRTSQRRATP